MTCGMFGKLPAKRDFITVGVPGPFLLLWEAWLQAAMASSKNQMGPSWLEAYLSSPLWRFWLGRDICGIAVTGAIMPSIDGVGRHFPLTVVAAAGESSEFAPPSLLGTQDWHHVAEEFLLATLDMSEDYDGTLAMLAALPVHEQIDAASGASTPIAGTALTLPAAEDTALDAILTEAERDMLRRDVRQHFYLWTIGGAGVPPKIISSRGLPPHDVMVDMLGSSLHADSDP